MDYRITDQLFLSEGIIISYKAEAVNSEKTCLYQNKNVYVLIKTTHLLGINMNMKLLRLAFFKRVDHWRKLIGVYTGLFGSDQVSMLFQKYKLDLMIYVWVHKFVYPNEMSFPWMAGVCSEWS